MSRARCAVMDACTAGFLKVFNYYVGTLAYITHHLTEMRSPLSIRRRLQ
jgi:hypothetical protein